MLPLEPVEAATPVDPLDPVLTEPAVDAAPVEPPLAVEAAPVLPCDPVEAPLELGPVELPLLPVLPLVVAVVVEPCAPGGVDEHPAAQASTNNHRARDIAREPTVTSTMSCLRCAPAPRPAGDVK